MKFSLRIVPVGLAALLVIGLVGCAQGRQRPAPGRDAANADWRQMATAEDRDRLRQWRKSWQAGIEAARKSGHGRDIDAEGALLDPDRAIDGAVPPTGSYRCRVFKLGADGTAMRDFTAYPAVNCRIATNGAISSFYKIDGAQRPSGMIFHDSSSRAVFLGTMMLGDETRTVDYGRDPKRNMVGFVERVDLNRWRLVIPSPPFESMVDVIELVPAAQPER